MFVAVAAAVRVPSCKPCRARFPRWKSRRMHAPMTRQCGIPSRLGGAAKQKSCMRKRSRRCQVAWGCNRWSAPARQHSRRTLYQAALESGGGDVPSLRAVADSRELLQAEGWEACPSWRAILQGARPVPPKHAGPGDWPHGWQFMAVLRVAHPQPYFRDIVLLPAMTPSARALVRSQAGPHAGSWLTAIPAEPATTLTPQAMQLALRRRLRMPLPLSHGRCGPTHGCGGQVDRFGDHALACPRTGLLARRAETLEHAWVRVAREAVGAEGQEVPQQWLAHHGARCARG